MRSPSKFLSEVFATLHLAVPLGGIQLAEAAVGFVNTVMMGFLGIQSLAAGALGVITFYTLTLICMGVIEGASPLAAEAFGAGNTERIRQIFAQGLWLVVALSLPMMLLTWHLDSILMLSGQEENTVALANTYLKAIVWSLPAAVGFFILKEVATAVNRPQLISAIALTSIPLNILANYLLIFGKLGLPPLGLAGIGWAGTFVYWVNFLAAAAVIGFHPWFKEYKLFASLQFNKQVFAELWQNGWPLGLEYASSLILFTLIALLSGYMGTTLLAANEIVVQTLEVSLIVPTAISYATMTRVGQMMGQNDPAGAKKAGFAAITIGVAAMSLIAVAICLFPEQIATIYLDASNSDNILAIRSAIPLLRIASLFLIALGLNLIALGTLLGIQDTRLPLLINILFQWGVGMTCGYLLCFHLNWGSIGLWSGLTIGITLATLFLIYRFYLSTSEIIQTSEGEEAADRSQATDEDQAPVLKSVS
ncbi:putative efflux protein, MATE family [Cylindrospermum stagnale PCC 7417]|uniref:Probable multidrug resistance protein NorM n=1 Tax=Cylindrospermum stagnale PCC 7417 TaxID=56107 RepID=K9X8Z5_9NOST|nr:MATE family efflux transporter [Cylindrospermum stagnale]AFZ28122.1 putative efflux protein, MATE family [Cylindrospermum stagnale PCC 7417]